MPDADDARRDYQLHRQLLELWKHENPIKTAKLQVLLAVNAGLAAAAQLSAGSPAPRWPLYAVGAVLSGVWLLSIGRTVLSQQHWKHKLNALARAHPGDPRFQVLDVAGVEGASPWWLRCVGGVSSKFYLVGAPLALTLGWLALLARALST